MPRRDGTGPNGQGPITGRGLGFCNLSNELIGRARGLRLGRGRGVGRRFFSKGQK